VYRLIVDFSWVTPICSINYTSRYLLNTVALPFCFIGLVMVTWAFHKGADPSGKDANGIHDCDDAVDTIADIDSDNEMKANKRADYYFAFFLCCEYRTPHWHACRLSVADAGSQPAVGQPFIT
jgi:hypothetical protein